MKEGQGPAPAVEAGRRPALGGAGGLARAARGRLPAPRTVLAGAAAVAVLTVAAACVSAYDPAQEPTGAAASAVLGTSGQPAPPWSWLAGAPDPLDAVLPEAEAARVQYVRGTFKITGPHTITATYSASIYADESDYGDLRVTGGGTGTRDVTGLSGPYQTRSYFGITTTPAQTHTLTLAGDALSKSATGRMAVAQLHYYAVGPIFTGQDVNYYFVRQTVNVGDGQAPSLSGSGHTVNLEDATVSFAFDEPMDASRTAPAGVRLSCGTTGLISLDGASAVEPDASTVTIKLTPEQKASLFSSSPGCSGGWSAALRASTFFDRGGNALPAASRVSMGFVGDTMLPEIDGPVTLDLGSGMLEMRFSEYVEAGSSGSVSIDPGDVSIPASSMSVSGETASITLSESDRVRLVLAYVPAGMRVSIDAGAFSDLAGHSFAGLTGRGIDVVPDTSPPGLLPGTRPSLDLNTGALSFAFNETVSLENVNMAGVKILDAGSSELLSLDGLAPTVQDGHSTSVAFNLDRVQRADAVGAARIAVPSGAFADAARNPIAALDAAPLDVTADRMPPQAVSNPAPTLYLGNGTLAIKFNEFIGKVRPWGILLRDMDGINNVALGGAEVLPPPPGEKYTDEIVVNLTRRQAAEAVIFDVRSVEANAAVFEDVSGNPYAGGLPGLVKVPDTAGPKLDAARPPLYKAVDNTLALSFAEYVNTSSAILGRINITDTGSGGASFYLDNNAMVPESNTDVAVITVSSTQASSISPVRGSLLLGMNGGAFKDMSENDSPAVPGVAIKIVPDLTVPGLTGTPSLNLNNLNLTMQFNKTIGAAVDTSGITIAAVSGANATHLSGAQVLSVDASTAVVGITEEQKASIIVARGTAEREMRISISPAAVADQRGNPLAGSANRSLAVTSDRTEPAISASQRPVLDLASGLLTVYLNEHANASRTNPGQVQLLNEYCVNGVPSEDCKDIELDGATVVPSGSPQQHVSIQLTPGQKADAVAYNSSRILSVGPGPLEDRGAFFDLSGNGAPTGLGASARHGDIQGHRMHVVEDAAPPILIASVDTPSLDLGTGTLDVSFDEHVSIADTRPGLVELIGAAPGRERIALGMSGVEAASPADSDAMSATGAVLSLTPAQKAAAESSNADGVDLVAGAFSDPSGNPIANTTAAMRVVDDGVAPSLDAAALPVLDLGDGTLTMRFDEYVDVSESNSFRVSLSAAVSGGGAGGICALPGGRVALSGAVAAAVEVGAADASVPGVPAGAAPGVVVSLTPAQKAAAVACAGASAVPAALSATSAVGAFFDLAASPNTNDLNTTGLDTVADAAAPRLDAAAPPVLDLGDGTLTMRFDEYVNVSAADPSLVSLGLSGGAGPGGGASLACAAAPAGGLLSGAAVSAVPVPAAAQGVPAGAAPGIVVKLTPAQKAAAGHCAGGQAGTRANAVSASSGAFADLSWNPSERVRGAVLSVNADTTPPGLASGAPPLLNLATGTLSLTFDEFVDASTLVISSIAFEDDNGGSRVALDGTATASQGHDGTVVVVGLAPTHLAGIATANSTAPPVRLDVVAGAVADLSGETNSLLDNVAIVASRDTAPPLLDAARPPALDLGTGVLTVRFSEAVRPAPDAASLLSIVPPVAGDGPIELAGASVSAGADPSETTVDLLPAQKAAAVDAQAAAEAAGAQIVLGVAAGAVADYALNRIEAVPSASLTVVADGSPPAIPSSVPPRLDLGDGTLTVRFNEYVSAESADVSRMALVLDSPAGSQLPLGGGMAGAAAPATIAAGESDTDAIVVRLTPDQKALAAAGGASRVVLEAGAVADLSGNALSPDASAALSAVRDGTAPRLENPARPVLDLAAGVLDVAFDEHVDPQSANLSRLLIVDRSGGVEIGLGGAALSPLPPGRQAGANLTVLLTPAQKTAVSAADAESGPVMLFAREPGAIADTYGNAMEPFEQTALLVLPDSSGPVPVSLGPGRPSLDLGTGVLTVRFDEEVLAAESDLSAVRFVNASDGTQYANLDGHTAMVPGGDASLPSSSLSVKLAPDRMAAIVGAAARGDDYWCNTQTYPDPAERAGSVSDAVRSKVRLAAGAGAFYDTTGNPSAQLTATAIDVATDLTPPSLDPDLPPLLNLVNRSIVVNFDEPVQILSLGSARVDNATERPFVPLPPTQHVAQDGGRRLHIPLSESNALEVGGFNNNAHIYIPKLDMGGLLRDLSCHFPSANLRAALVQSSDNDPPAMENGYPRLDMGTGVLSMKFSEAIDAGAVDTSAVSIVGTDGSAIRLGVAAAVTPSSGYVDEVGLALSPAQRYAAVVLARDSGQLYISMAAGAVSDRSYLGSAEITARPLQVDPDILPPRLLDGDGPRQRPVLDAEAKSLTLHFDEHVRVGSTMPELVDLLAEDAPGVETWSLDLQSNLAVVAAGFRDNATTPASTSLSISLGGANTLRAILGGAVDMSADPNAFADASDVLSARIERTEMHILRDPTPPRLNLSAPQYLDLGDGRLEITFSEPVNATTTGAAGVVLTPAGGGANGSREVALARSGVESDLLSRTINVTLAPPDKAAAVALAVSRLSIEADSFADASGNLAAEGPGVNLTVTDDTTRPKLDPDTTHPSVLDLDAGTVVIRFDEHVNTTELRLGSVGIAGAETGPAIFSLAGAPAAPWLPPPPPGRTYADILSQLQRDTNTVGAPGIEASLSQRQRAAASLLAEPWLAVGADAFEDLSGYKNLRETARLAVLRDAISPAPDAGMPARLDLGAGNLTVWLDEYVRVPDTDASKIAIERAGQPAQDAVQLAGADVSRGAPHDPSAQPPLPDTASLAVNFTMNAAQKAAAVMLAGPAGGGDIRVQYGASAFTDLSDRTSGASSAPPAVLPDRTAPMLADGSRPLLNLESKTLSVRFDEYIDASTVDASRMYVEGADGGSRAALGGAGARDRDGTVVVLDLTDANFGAINAANASASPVRLDIGAGAFRDLSGNGNGPAPDVALDVTSDAIAPALSAERGPELDLNDGSLRVWFTEPVDVAGIDLSEVSLSAGDTSVQLGGARAGADSDPSATVLVSLTLEQRARTALAEAAAPAGLVTLGIAAAAVADAAHNGIGAVEGRAVDVTPDRTAPARDDAPVRLDLGTGMLAIGFDEHVNATAARLDLASLEAPGAGTGGTAQPVLDSLAGATVAEAGDIGSPLVTIGLTASQKAAAASAPGESLRIASQLGAFSDLSGNPSDALGEQLRVDPDGTGPSLAAGVRPLLNLAAGTLSLTFDEFVDAALTDASRMSVRDSLGGSVGLGGAAPRAGGSGTVVTLGLLRSHLDAVSEANRTAPPILLDVEPGAFRDLSGNGNGQALGVRIASTDDASAPELSAGRGPELDLNDGTLRVWFTEPVDAAGIDLPGVVLSAAGGGDAVALGGARAEAASAASDAAAITLTLAQRAAAVALAAAAPSAGGGLSLGIGADAVRDLAYNGIAAVEGRAVAVTPDTTPPAPDGTPPRLDLNDGTLSVRLDEHVDAESTRTELLSLSARGSNATILPSLAGASASAGGQDGDAARGAGSPLVVVKLTAAQRAALAASPLLALPATEPGMQAESGQGAARAPADAAAAASAAADLLVLAAPGAFSDLSGNPSAQAGVRALPVPDSSAPVLAAGSPPVFNLTAGTLSLAFDEYIEASSVNASLIAARDARGGSQVRLAGASTPAMNGTAVLLGLTDAHVSGVLAANSTAPPVRLDVAAGALYDLYGNAYEGAANVTVELAAAAQTAMPPPSPPDGGTNGTVEQPPAPPPVQPPAPPPVQPPAPPVQPVQPAQPAPPAVVFPSGGGSGGGGGGGGGGGTGGSGRTGVGPAGGAAPTAFVHSVSWDCEAGSATVLLGGIISGDPEVSLLMASGAERGDRDPDRDMHGAAAYTAPFAGDEIISVRVVVADGRNVQSLSETVRTWGECAGRAVVAGDAGAAPDADAGTDGPDAEAGRPPAAPGAPDGDGAEDAAMRPEPAPLPDEGAERDAEPAPGGSAPAGAERPQDAPDAAGAGQRQDTPSPPPAPAGESDSAPPPADDRDADGQMPAPQEDDALQGGGGGGCLIATAAYGTELAPQVQALREMREAAIASSPHAASLLGALNAAYYSFSPHVADLERSSPALRAAAGAAIAPPLALLHPLHAAPAGGGGGDAPHLAALAVLAAVGAAAAAPAVAAVARRRRSGPGRLRPWAQWPRRA